MNIYIEARCTKKSDIQPIKYFVFAFSNGEAYIDAEEIDWRFDDDNVLHAKFKNLYYLEDDSPCGNELIDTPIVGMAVFGETDDDFDIQDLNISIVNDCGDIRESEVIAVRIPTL